MNPKKIRIITGILCVVTGLVWILWDIYAVSNGGGYATISTVITDFSYYNPALPFIFGVLIDHWLIPEFKPGRLLKRK